MTCTPNALASDFLTAYQPGADCFSPALTWFTGVALTLSIVMLSDGFEYIIVRIRGG